MTKNEVIALARTHGFHPFPLHGDTDSRWVVSGEQLEAFAAALTAQPAAPAVVELNGVKSTEAAGFFSYSLQADSGYTAASTGHRISAEQYGAICRILATLPGPQP